MFDRSILDDSCDEGALGFEIKEMTESDVVVIQEIAEECCLSFWSEAGLREELRNPASVCVAAKAGGKIIGFLVARLIIAENSIEIYNIGVRKEYRRRKVASGLLDYLLKFREVRALGNIYLEVRESNQGAISFYFSKGFGFLGIRKGFYRDPVENAILLFL